MKNSTILIIFTVLVILLITFRKPINMAISRGYKNNNPGNIRLTFDSTGKKTLWKGEIEGTDKAFKKFKSMAYGYRAMFITLTSYLSKGVNTIEKIISRYAPSNENDTTSYINTVSRKSGIESNRVITSDDQLQRLIIAMSFVENGVSADANEVVKGYELFKFS